jgi:hypothetical protein
MRTGRPYADFEEFEEAGVHDLITIEFIVKANEVGLCAQATRVEESVDLSCERRN